MTRTTKVSDFTVGELNETLKQFPQELPIVVSGYETGFENILEPRVEKLEQNAENKYYDGEFQEIVKQTFQKNPTIISSLPDISVSNILLRCLDEKCPRQLC